MMDLHLFQESRNTPGCLMLQNWDKLELYGLLFIYFLFLQIVANTQICKYNVKKVTYSAL